MILETSFIIDLWTGAPKAVAMAKRIDDEDEPVYVPTPVLFELWEGVARSRRPRDEVVKITQFIESHDVVLFSDQDAREAGLISGRMSGAGRTMGTVDVMVAGMARARGEVVLTSDRRFRELSPEVKVELYD